jgi:hypothetical protein
MPSALVELQRDELFAIRQLHNSYNRHANQSSKYHAHRKTTAPSNRAAKTLLMQQECVMNFMSCDHTRSELGHQRIREFLCVPNG